MNDSFLNSIIVVRFVAIHTGNIIQVRYYNSVRRIENKWFFTVLGNITMNTGACVSQMRFESGSWWSKFTKRGDFKLLKKTPILQRSYTQYTQVYNLLCAKNIYYVLKKQMTTTTTVGIENTIVKILRVAFRYSNENLNNTHKKKPTKKKTIIMNFFRKYDTYFLF